MKPEAWSAGREVLLNSDLKKVGKPCLPDNRKSTLTGPMVLQVVEARDIACPKRAAGEGSGGGGGRRMLRLELTDGENIVTGIEYRELTALRRGCSLPPGTKLALGSNAQVKCQYGVHLFQGNHLTLLGGTKQTAAPKFQLYDPREAAETAAAARAGRAAANKVATAALADKRGERGGGARGSTIMACGGGGDPRGMPQQTTVDDNNDAEKPAPAFVARQRPALPPTRAERAAAAAAAAAAARARPARRRRCSTRSGG